MEFLDGETLTDQLRRGLLPQREARAIALPICAGLAEAHRNHVGHGDLKSSNVFLTTGPEGAIRAVITDFGLARKPEAGQGTAQSGERGGMPDYMAPELLKGEMKRAIGVACLLLLLALIAAAICPLSMNCPTHDGWVANYTGARMVDGAMVGVYHCPRGHNFLVRCN